MAATQKNQLFDPGFLFTPSDSFRHNTKRHRRQTTHRRHSVPKARPIVLSAKNGAGRWPRSCWSLDGAGICTGVYTWHGDVPAAAVGDDVVGLTLGQTARLRVVV